MLQHQTSNPDMMSSHIYSEDYVLSSLLLVPVYKQLQLQLVAVVLVHMHLQQ